MRRSITSAGTERALLVTLLVAEAVLAGLLLSGPGTAPPARPAATATRPAPAPVSGVQTLADGRMAQLLSLGGPQSRALLTRIGRELDGAAGAVTAFWGADWPRTITVVAAGSDAQFAALGGGSADVAATTTAERIMFAPGAAAMTDDDLRIVLRHELFHYAARPATAVDAPPWLTEGVADYVARPAAPLPAGPAEVSLPTDAQLAAPGPGRSSAYDRAWWFSRFVADRYGPAALRTLYVSACGPGHPDVAAAVRGALGADLDAVLGQWRHWLPT